MNNGAWGPHLRSGRTKRWAIGIKEAERKRSRRKKKSRRRATHSDPRLFTGHRRRRRAAGKNHSPNHSESRQPFGAFDAESRRAKIAARRVTSVRLQLVTFGSRVARKITATPRLRSGHGIGCATKARAKSRQDAGGTLLGAEGLDRVYRGGAARGEITC